LLQPYSSNITIPQADTTIHPNDILVLVGSDEAISRLPHD